MNQTIEHSGELVSIDRPEPEQPTQIAEQRSTFDILPATFEAGLKRRKKNRKSLITWIQEELVEGTDWGRIHVIKKAQCDKGQYCTNPYHFSKPSLWKAGAEKIIGMMGLRVTWPSLIEYEGLIVRGKTVEQIMLRCELKDAAGVLVAEGIGARDVRQDGDLNKALKMAKKSSLIDAVLNCAGLSEVFTQDIEDMDQDKIETGAQDPYNRREEPTKDYFPNENNKPVSTHCPIGKQWKGKPWGEVEESFLSWIVLKIDDKPDVLKAATEELARRKSATPESRAKDLDERVDNAMSGKKLSDWARELVAAKTFDAVLAIKEGLPPEFEPSLRTLMKTRETELGPN